MTPDEAQHWRNVLIGVVLPLIWGFGYTIYLVATRQGSVSFSVRYLAFDRGYLMLAVGLTAAAVGLIVHWFGQAG